MSTGYLHYETVMHLGQQLNLWQVTVDIKKGFIYRYRNRALGNPGECLWKNSVGSVVKYFPITEGIVDSSRLTDL